MRVLESINAVEAGVCRHFTLLPIAATGWRTHDGVAQTRAGYTGAGKILIPHKSWPCGMAAGIPVPEQGALVFEASLKLDQAYDVARRRMASGMYLCFRRARYRARRSMVLCCREDWTSS